jgi:hypothetical protein
MNRTLKGSPLMLAILPLFAATNAPAAEPGEAAPVAVSDRRWTLEVGLADARHPDWQYPGDWSQPGPLRYESQSIPAPHENWGLDLRLSFRLPKRAGRLAGRIFIENLGDQVFNGSRGIAVPYEASDGSQGTIHTFANPRIEPQTSDTLTWSRVFVSRGAYSLQHEVGFVSRGMSYGYSITNGGLSSRTTLSGLRVGLVATRRLAYGAAVDLLLGCTLARRTERITAYIPYYDDAHALSYVMTDNTERSTRALPDASLRLRVPLSGRLQAALGYTWESYGPMHLGKAGARGAFVALTLGIGD